MVMIITIKESNDIYSVRLRYRNKEISLDWEEADDVARFFLPDRYEVVNCMNQITNDEFIAMRKKISEFIRAVDNQQVAGGPVEYAVYYDEMGRW